jgi:hypothetical protein
MVQWYWQIDAIKTLTGIQKPRLTSIPQTFKNIDGSHLKSKCRLTGKLPPSNSNRFELIALGRQPHTN